MQPGTVKGFFLATGIAGVGTGVGTFALSYVGQDMYVSDRTDQMNEFIKLPREEMVDRIKNNDGPPSHNGVDDNRVTYLSAISGALLARGIGHFATKGNYRFAMPMMGAALIGGTLGAFQGANLAEKNAPKIGD